MFVAARRITRLPGMPDGFSLAVQSLSGVSLNAPNGVVGCRFGCGVKLVRMEFEKVLNQQNKGVPYERYPHHPPIGCQPPEANATGIWYDAWWLNR